MNGKVTSADLNLFANSVESPGSLTIRYREKETLAQPDRRLKGEIKESKKVLKENADDDILRR